MFSYEENIENKYLNEKVLWIGSCDDEDKFILRSWFGHLESDTSNDFIPTFSFESNIELVSRQVKLYDSFTKTYVPIIDFDLKKGASTHLYRSPFKRDKGLFTTLIDKIVDGKDTIFYFSITGIDFYKNGDIVGLFISEKTGLKGIFSGFLENNRTRIFSFRGKIDWGGYLSENDQYENLL